VIISDAKGCSDTINVTVGNLSTVNINLSNLYVPKCYAQCNGSFVINVQNAVQPVTYSVTGQPTTAVQAIKNVCPGFYTVKAIDGIGCPATTTLNFPIPPAFSYSAADAPAICVSKNATLTAIAEGGVPPYDYFWQPGNLHGKEIVVSPLATTVYSVLVRDTQGCDRGDQEAKVPVNLPLNISLNAASSGVCPGSTAQIAPTVSGGDGNYSYYWMPGAITTPSVFVNSVSFPDYSLTVTDGCGSPPVFALVRLKVFPVIQPLYSINIDSGCVPLCVNLVNITPKSSSAIWNFGDQPIEQAGDKISYCYKNEGHYTLKLSIIDSNGCRAEFKYYSAIHALPKPRTGFHSLPEIITLNNSDQVLFKNTTNGAQQFRWFLDGRDKGASKDLTLSFNDTTCHHLKLVSYAANNCRDSTERGFCVYEGFNLYMPSAFSPDGDGLNDILIPKGTGWLFNDYLFEVYDRWGQKVFHTSNVSEGWTGGFRKNNNLPGTYLADKNDVYVWRIKVRDNLQALHEMNGFVMVMK
jgi:gliding motility-associated-like protein